MRDERMQGRAMSTRLGDGCRAPAGPRTEVTRIPYSPGFLWWTGHVFLDVGSNRGVHVRFLTEPHLFPNSSYLAAGHFARYFGPGFATDPTVCAFGFEPNVAHSARLARLARLYRSAGRRVEFFMVAAQAHAGVVTMYNHRDDAAASDWRFGAKRLSHRPVNVSALDLSAFVRRELIGRAVPAAASADARPPSIVVKLDVEGDELAIFERMLDTHALCAINLASSLPLGHAWRTCRSCRRTICRPRVPSATKRATPEC